MGPTRVNRKLSFESGEEQIKGYGKVTQNTEIFSTKYGNNILEVGSPAKPLDKCIELSDCSEIWQVSQQQCCWDTCQNSKQYKKITPQSCFFETLRDGGGKHFMITILWIEDFEHHYMVSSCQMSCSVFTRMRGYQDSSHNNGHQGTCVHVPLNIRLAGIYVCKW